MNKLILSVSIVLLVLIFSTAIQASSSKFAFEDDNIGVKVSRNFPNPCNASTTIRIDAKEAENSVTVTLRVFNINGRQIKVVEFGDVAGKRLSRRIDFNDVAAGAYFCQIMINGKRASVMNMSIIK